MSEVSRKTVTPQAVRLQGFLTNKKQPPRLGPPFDPRYRPTVGLDRVLFLMSEVSLFTGAYARR